MTITGLKKIETDSKKCGLRCWPLFLESIVLLLTMVLPVSAQSTSATTPNKAADHKTTLEVAKPVRLDRRDLSGLDLKRVTNPKEPERELYQRLLFKGDDISVYVVSSGNASTFHKSYGLTEFVQIIAGQARLDPENGDEMIFTSGDRFIAPKGYRGEWETQGGEGKYLIELSVIANERTKGSTSTELLPVRVDKTKLSGIGLTEQNAKSGVQFNDLIHKDPELEVTLHALSPQTLHIDQPWPEQMITVLSGSIEITPSVDGTLRIESAQAFFTGEHLIIPSAFKGKLKIEAHGLFRYLSVKKSE